MVIRFLMESGVNIAETYGDIEGEDKRAILELVGEKAKQLFLTLHPEMKPENKSK